jgi:hypothetical protein
VTKGEREVIDRGKLLNVAEVSFFQSTWHQHIKISYAGETVSAELPRSPAKTLETVNVLMDKLLVLVGERFERVCTQEAS